MRWLLCLVVVFVASCSPQDATEGTDPAEGTNPVEDTNQSQSQTQGDNTVADTTSAQSVGLVRIGPSAYDLVFSCVDRGAGEVLAVGIGRDINNKPVEAFVQAFLAEPYIGLLVGDGDEQVLFEPRLGAPLVFTFEGDIVRFDTVDFVSDLDLNSGEFTPAGIGSVVVECRSYERAVPEQ